MAMMRCKLVLNGIEHVGGGVGYSGVKIKMGAVYEPDEKTRAESENAIFGKYTPHGAFEATIYNEHLVQELPKLLGREFYLDFTVA
jgi:hypothetical protein